MARKGRHREVGVSLAGDIATLEPKQIGRYPCGKLRPQRERNAISPSAIQRIVLLAKNKAADPIFETPLGVLRLQGEITDTQTAAALEYARLRGRADRALGLRARSAKSRSYQMGYSALPSGSDDLDAFEKASEKFAELRSNLRKLVVMSGGYRAGITMIDLVDRVCIDGSNVEASYYDSLRAGLTESAIFFGLLKKGG